MDFFLRTFKMLNEHKGDENSDTADVNLSSESVLISPSPCSKVQVFLRIRPILSSIQSTRNDDVYTVEDSSTLLVKNVNLSEIIRRSKPTKLNENVPRKKFTFTRIFNQETDQSKFFNEIIKPAVIDLLNNQSSTVISYGTIDAGKTYTLFGSTLNPGIIPRTIELIYSSLNCTLTPWYKPKQFNSVINLSDECDRTLEIDIRDKLLSCRLIDKSMCEEAYKMLENLESNRNQEIFKDSMYSVWLSFVEIYNDGIFDLLEVDEEGKNVQLRLAIDKHGTTYIQGMRSVCATTGLEAYEILNAGLSRLSTITVSNYKSSRSHSIFTIKLLKYEKDCAPSDVEVSSISFCDLAGTGRIQKSVSNGKQFKESRSINTSLLAFGRCLKIISQGHLRQSIGSFRDSKLTRIFQYSMSGKESIILLINVNPSSELLAETQSVLNFASIAMKLTSDIPKEDKRLIDCQTPISVTKIRPSTSSKSLREREIDDIRQENKQLLTEIKQLKSSTLKREYEIRQELADFYSKKLNDLEENWKNRMAIMEEEKVNLIDFSVSQIESYYKGKLEECTNRKRKRIDRGDYEENLNSEEIHKSESYQSSTKMVLFRHSLESVKNENKELIAQKNQYSFEMSLIKETLKKFAECIRNHTDFQNLDLEENSVKILVDEDVTSYLSAIQQYIKKPLESEKSPESFQESKVTSSKSVQCNSKCSIIRDFCKEIQELLDPHSVKLPEIDNSFDLSNDIQDLDNMSDELTTSLPKIKELIIENVSKIIKLEIESCNKSDQLKDLENQIKHQEKEILQMRMRCEELDSARSSLARKLEDFNTNLKSKEFFKNPDFYAIERHMSIEALNQTVFTEPSLTSRHSCDDDRRLNSFDLEKDESSAMRSSSGSSRNDSGLASSIECAVYKVTDEKACQTSTFYEVDNNQFQERLMQLKCDYNQMKAHHLEESSRVTELSQELEHIREAMSNLKENTSIKERIISEYQNKLTLKKEEIERLISEKRQLEMKCIELNKHLQETSREYEKKLNESQVTLKMHKEGESRAKKCIEDYWKKSMNLGSELSIAHSELEKKSIKCLKEHVIKIGTLEEELNIKEINESELEQKINAYEKDLAGMNELSVKVNDFEHLLDKIQKEKMELHRLINERTESQMALEGQLEYLVTKIDERDNQVLSLKTELGSLIKTNMWNSRKAKELGKEVGKLMEKLCSMKEDIIESEEARKDLQRSSSKEIDNLRARLTIFEENAELLNVVCETNENKQKEADTLKFKLLEKEKELEFFKKNRNSTIQRYECLVRQLQDALKMNHHSNKLKKIFSHKQKYCLTDLKESLSSDIQGSDPQILDWKLFEDEYTSSSSYSNIQTDVHFTPVASSMSIVSKEEPCRLIVDDSEKSLETEKKAYMKLLNAPCRDVRSSSEIETTVRMDTSDDDLHPIRHADDQTNSHLHHRKS